MDFDKHKHIDKMKAPVAKLVAELLKKGISFNPTDGELHNVIFTAKTKEVKISWHSFYRFSGICNVYRDDPKNKDVMIPVPVTDEMYLFDFIKPIIEILIEKA